MTRALVVHPGPGFSVHDVYTGWCEGMRANGLTVAEFNLGDRLSFYDAALLEIDGKVRKALDTETAIELAANGIAAALYKVRPQILFIVSGFWADVEVLDHARRYGTRVVVLHTESPYEDDRQIQLAPHADVNLINDPTNLAAWEAVAPTVYAPHAYRESTHRPGPTVPRLERDLSFVGTGYPSRVEFLEALVASENLAGLRVGLAGNWMRLKPGSPLRQHLVHDIDECFDNDDAVPLYRSSRAGLNLYRREANDAELIHGWSMGPRELEMAACGLFFLRDPRPESDQVFPMLPTFTSPEDASELLRWWLDHDSQREDAARRAREAIADRTFTAHAAKLMRLFDRQPVSA